MKKVLIILIGILLVPMLLAPLDFSISNGVNVGMGTAFAQSEDEALKLNKRGMEAYQHGRYQEALKYFEEALKIRRELNIPQKIAISLNNIGGVYSSLGQYDK